MFEDRLFVFLGNESEAKTWSIVQLLVLQLTLDDDDDDDDAVFHFQQKHSATDRSRFPFLIHAPFTIPG
jgi:hypothetical protein